MLSKTLPLVVLLTAASPTGASESDSQQLLVASRLGLDRVIGYLLERGAEPNIQGDPIQGLVPPLVAAARRGSQPTVELLLAAGAEPNFPEADRSAALVAAIESRHADVANLLLAHGAVVGSDEILLSSAAETGNAELIAALLEMGLAVNAKHPYRPHPLRSAAASGSAEVVRLLLAAGAAPIDAGAELEGQTPLLIAAELGHAEVVELLLQHGPQVNYLDRRGESALSLAAAAGSAKTVRALLHGGADPNTIVPEDGFYFLPKRRTVLMRSALAGHGEVVAELLSGGADANWISSGKETALSLMAEADDPEIARQLLSAGADPELRVDYNEHTALGVAAREGSSKVARLLIESGAEIEATDFSGLTPLMEAAANGHVALVETLLKAGSDVNRTSEFGTTALSRAVGEGAYQVVRILIASGANSNIRIHAGSTPLHWAVANGDLASARALLAAGADVEAQDDEGISVLMIAAALYSERPDHGVMRELLDAEANLDLQDTRGATALVHAILARSASAVTQLLVAGANATIPTNRGNSPMALAREKIASLLVEHGLDPTPPATMEEHNLERKAWWEATIDYRPPMIAHAPTPPDPPDLTLVTPPPPPPSPEEQRLLDLEDALGQWENVARFPDWPPPAPSSWHSIGDLLRRVGELLTLEGVSDLIKSALNQAGYFQHKWYSVPHGGFAIATRVEQIESDGTPKPGDARWALEIEAPEVHDVASYLRALFTAPKGYFRVIVFVVTPDSCFMCEPGPPVTREEAVSWLNKGAFDIPTSVGERAFTSEHSCVALVYEFVKPSEDSEPRMRDDPLTGKKHLETSGLLPALEISR